MDTAILIQSFLRVRSPFKHSRAVKLQRIRAGQNYTFVYSGSCVAAQNKSLCVPDCLAFSDVRLCS